MLGLWMLFIDAPEHSRLRKLMNKGFSPAVAESLRPQVEAIVDRMLEPLRHASEAELMHEIAHPLPVRVIHDPQQFKDACRLNLARLNNAHLAFGAGPHFCIGNQLARLEGQVAILRIVQQFPRMRLAAQRPEWAPNMGLRGLKSLPVAVQ